MQTITFEQLKFSADWLLDEVPSAGEVHSLCIDMLDNAKEYEDFLGKHMKVKDLKDAIGFMCRGTKKADLLSEYRNIIVGRLARVKTMTYSFGRGEYDKALREHFDAVFQPERWAQEMKDLAKVIAEAKEARKKKLEGFNNPQTLEDFQLVCRVKGEDSLEIEQLERYDALRVEHDKASRIRLRDIYSRRYAIDLEGVSFVLIDTKHTQKDYDLFVVQFTEWLPRRLWRQIFERAKEFGGWYSGYDVGEAVPGLQFKSDMQRKNYCENVLCGGAQLAEHIEYVKYLSTLNASKRLTVLADSMISAAAEDEESAKDAKSNTPRRAAHQASRIERAKAKEALAGTMKKVAGVIDADPDHILSGMKYRTDFQTLRSIGFKYPRYEVGKELAKDLYAQCVLKEAKLGASMLNKRIREAKTDRLRLNDKIVEQFMNKGVEAWWLFEHYTHRSRLRRMGISSPWELRHAQRALLTLTVQPDAEPEWVTLERDLVGAKIPGFFPTPPALIRAMCDAVELTKEDIVLDPSCGKGDILLYAVENYDVTHAMGYEVVPKLVNLCRAKGLNSVHCVDCMDMAPEICGLYAEASVILMNPPFEQKQAVDHFLHAWENARSGTRIACVIPNGSSSRKLSDIMDGVGGEITPNPEGAFRSAFRSTNVSTSLIVITKE